QSVLYSQLMLRCGLAELPVGTAWAPPEAIGTSIAAPNSSVATNVRRLPTIGWHLLARGADACPGGAAPVPGDDSWRRWDLARLRPTGVGREGRRFVSMRLARRILDRVGRASS